MNNLIPVRPLPSVCAAVIAACSVGHAQSLADCNPSLWRSGSPAAGSTVQFTMSAAPACVVANLLSVSPGPIQFGSQQLAIGAEFFGFPIALIPPSGEPVSASITFPASPEFLGLDVYQQAVGLTLAQFPPVVVGASPRFRVHGTAPASGELVLLGEQAVDNGISSIQTLAQLLGTTPEFLTNDGNTSLIGNPWLPWSLFYAGSEVTLPMGGPGNEAMFVLPSQLPFAFSTFVDGLVPQPALGQVPNVMPLRNHDLADLVGRTFVAVVYDSAIGINYQPLQSNLQGERYGLLAFTVLDVLLPGTISESGSSSSYYDLRVRIEAPMAVAGSYSVPLRDEPADSIQIDQAIWQNGLLTVTGTSAVGATATMTVSIDGFTFESPMVYAPSAAQYQARFRVVQNLVGRRVTISTLEGGSDTITVQ